MTVRVSLKRAGMMVIAPAASRPLSKSPGIVMDGLGAGLAGHWRGRGRVIATISLSPSPVNCPVTWAALPG